MRTALLPLWRAWALPLLVLAEFGLLALAAEDLWRIGVLAVVFLLAAIVGSRGKQFKLCRTVWAYRTLRGENLSLHFPSELVQYVERDGVLKALIFDYDALVRYFGFGLRRRVAVYLLPQIDDINQVIGKPYGGYALILHNAIVAAAVEPYRRILRHELVHLFGARLGSLYPSFKSEGLCEWISWDGGMPILDEEIRRWLDNNDLSAMLDRRFFPNPNNWKVGYHLAGRFTGFLVEKFGWTEYCNFYKRARLWNYRRVFERVFGITLNDAEALWRTTLREDLPEPSSMSAPKV